MDRSTNSRLQVLRRNTDAKVHGNRVDTTAGDAYIVDVPGSDDLESGPDVAPENPGVPSNSTSTDSQLDGSRIQNPPNLNIGQTFTEEPESVLVSSSVQVLTDNTTATITNNTIRTVSGDLTITTGRGLATANPDTIRAISEMFTAMKQTSTAHRTGAYAAAAPPINQTNYYAYPSPQQQFHTPGIGGPGQGFGFGQATGISSASTSPYLFQANSQVLTLGNHSSNTPVGMNNTGPGAEIWVSPSDTRRTHTLDQPLPLRITSPRGGFGGNPAQSYTSWNTRTLTTDSESGAGMYVASPTEYDSPLLSPNPNANSTRRNPFCSG